MSFITTFEAVVSKIESEVGVFFSFISKEVVLFWQLYWPKVEQDLAMEILPTAIAALQSVGQSDDSFKDKVAQAIGIVEAELPKIGIIAGQDAILTAISMANQQIKIPGNQGVVTSGDTTTV